MSLDNYIPFFPAGLILVFTGLIFGLISGVTRVNTAISSSNRIWRQAHSRLAVFHFEPFMGIFVLFIPQMIFLWAFWAIALLILVFTYPWSAEIKTPLQGWVFLRITSGFGFGIYSFVWFIHESVSYKNAETTFSKNIQTLSQFDSQIWFASALLFLISMVWLARIGHSMKNNL